MLDETKKEPKLMFSRNSLDETLNQEDYHPEYLIALFEKNFADDYAAEVGVWEGYSLKEHTLMVSRQFERYFADKELPAHIDKNFMRVILALHDIGKPQAVKNGEKHLQHKYTLDILRPALSELNFNEREIKVANALLDGDPVGRYIQSGDPSIAVQEIKKMAAESELPLDQFLELLLVYYRVDAGSYTEDAGGKRALDRLFVFDHENKELRFSPSVQEQIVSLKELVLQQPEIETS